VATWRLPASSLHHWLVGWMQPIVVTRDSYHALGAWKPIYLLQKCVLKCWCSLLSHTGTATIDCLVRHTLAPRRWWGAQLAWVYRVHYAACFLHPQQFLPTLPFTTQYLRSCSRLKSPPPAHCGHLASVSIFSTSLVGGVDAANSRHT
jgi:hypothetical protein